MNLQETIDTLIYHSQFWSFDGERGEELREAIENLKLFNDALFFHPSEASHGGGFGLFQVAIEGQPYNIPWTYPTDYLRNKDESTTSN